MRRLVLAVLAIASMMTIVSCDDTETYADQKEKEQTAINRFINESKISVITESEFKEQGYTTDVDKNEYVLMQSTGVYMQIVREGCGEKLKDGETATVLCRFTETNLLTDSVQLSNDIQTYHYLPEKMTVIDNSGTFTGMFISSSSLMYTAYGSTAVPSGWLIPFTYIKVGRLETASDEIAKVNLIVPHKQGQAYATSSVYPCFYTITYERGQ